MEVFTLLTNTAKSLPNVGLLAAFILFLGSPSELHAEAQGQCNYADLQGIEIEFASEHVSGNPSLRISRTKDMESPISIDEVLGKRAKITGKSSGVHYGKQHDLRLADCSWAFMLTPNGRISRLDAKDLGIKYIDSPSGIWSHSTEKDPMTDEKSCRVIASYGNGTPTPMFFWHSSEGASVGAIGADFPARPITFRVDSNSAISQDEHLTESRARLLVSQIKSGGERLLVGGYKWPYDYRKLNELPLDGLKKEIEACESAMGL